MTDTMTQIGLTEAEGLLHTDPNLHVVVMDKRVPEGFREERWERHRVKRALKTHGAFLSGPEARRANHGLCTKLDGDVRVFIETKHV